MILSEIIRNIDCIKSTGDCSIEIEHIAYDSRKVKRNTLFVCIDGTTTDGHKYISQAYENGAVAFLTQKEAVVPEGAAVIQIKDTRRGLAMVSDQFFDHPSGKFPVIGVTGTKGKTTITHMAKTIVESAGKKSGLIGTISNMIGDETLYSARTTPESLDLQELFVNMIEKEMDMCIMEVSSQGLMLHRVTGTELDIAVFTNIEKDHISPTEHKDFEDYFNQKLKIFNMAKRAVINLDSDKSEVLLQKCPKDHLTYSIQGKADIMAENIVTNADSVEFKAITPWFTQDMKVALPGLYNLSNALAAIGICGLMGISHQEITAGLLKCKVRGRSEIVASGNGYTVMLDYAHNAMSLESLLKEAKHYAKGRIVCVFGCGGNKDISRRFEMGEISGKLADFTIITSDNPRNEKPEDIIEDIEKGISKTKGKYIKIVNRRDAMKYAIENAQKDDMIIFTGKGHENYQMFKDKTIHFDEKEVVEEILLELELK